jgi:Flagellar assembly protein T, C-terminal domain
MQSNRRRLIGFGALCAVLLSVCSHPMMSAAQSARPADARLEVGCIIAIEENRVAAGQGDTVVIDQGKTRGVRAGDRFVVLDDNLVVVHPSTKQRIRAPRQVIGEVSVVHVEERAATAVVITSSRELSRGAIVVRVTAL